MAAVKSAAYYDVTPAPFPAQTKTASSTINGTETTATLMSFADKILITVTQQGRLAHWVSCSLMGLIIDFVI
jgi:proteasome assembly chaperone 3